MKKIPIVITCLFVFTLIFASTALAGNTYTPIGTLKYGNEESVFLNLPGNQTLLFNNSTRAGANDLCIQRVQTNNSTFFRLWCRNVSGDLTYTFDNHTIRTYYFFLLNNLSQFYYVRVNFSALHVPLDPFLLLANLTNKTQRQNATIANLTARLVNATYQIAVLSDKLANYNVIKNNSLNLSSKVTTLTQSLTDKNNENTGLYKSIEEATGLFAISYIENGQSHYLVNISWLLIGMVLCFILIFLVKRKMNPNAQHQGGGVSNIPFVGGMFGKKKVQEQVTYEDPVGPETQILRRRIVRQVPVEPRQPVRNSKVEYGYEEPEPDAIPFDENSADAAVDEYIRQHPDGPEPEPEPQIQKVAEQQAGPEPHTTPPTEEQKRVNYWDSESGKKRRELMRHMQGRVVKDK